jgi:NADH:ubiquinone reductase (H+-translocating)
MMPGVVVMGRANRQVEGAREHAFSLDAGSLPWLQAVLPTLAERRRQLVVVGGGRSGVEAAASFADSHPGLRVLLVTRDEVAPACTLAVREHVRRSLQRLGVELREHVSVDGVQRDHLSTDGGKIVFSACLWAVGTRRAGRIPRVTGSSSGCPRAKIAS